MPTLKEIPFLVLDVEVPVDKILEEVNTLTEYCNWVPPGFENNEKFWEHHKNYKHFAITTINPDRKHTNVVENYNFIVDGKPYNYYEHRKWFVSEVAEQKLPFTIEFIKSISDMPIIAKVVKTPPGHMLGWHNHQSDPVLGYNAPEQAITHIPLISSEDVRHYVSTYLPEDRWMRARHKVDNDPRIWGHSFEVGKVSIFNGAHPHMMSNYTDKERLTILIYNDMKDNQTMRNHIIRAISKYEGPLIPLA